MLTETGNENYYGEAIAVLRQALKTEQKTAVSPGKGTGFIDARALGITVLRQALVDADDTSQKRVDGKAKREHEWVGLTEEDMESLFLNEDGVRFARYIEAKLKEKNK
jgi:hypothetical protein